MEGWICKYYLPPNPLPSFRTPHDDAEVSIGKEGIGVGSGIYTPLAFGTRQFPRAFVFAVYIHCEMIDRQISA